jgi:hypothetical protein
VSGLDKITERPPFNTDKKIVSIVDLDGVIVKYGKEADDEENYKRLCGLRSIIRRSEEFFLKSSRIPVNENGWFWKLAGSLFDNKPISTFPFLTDSSVKKLENFARSTNHFCKVKSQIGLRKMRSCFEIDDDFLNVALKTLDSGKSLAYVGSSIIDRRIAKLLAKKAKSERLSIQNFYYFDTNHILF